MCVRTFYAHHRLLYVVTFRIDYAKSVVHTFNCVSLTATAMYEAASVIDAVNFVAYVNLSATLRTLGDYGGLRYFFVEARHRR
jgi:hypothetical protein